MIAAFARSLTAVWLALGAELGFVVASHHAEFAGVWELQWGVLWLTPVVVTCSLPPTLVGVAFNLSLARAAELRGRVGITLVGVVSSALLSVALTTGRHFQAPGLRLAVVSVVVLASGAALWRIAPRLAALGRRHSAKRAAVLVVVLVVLEAVNQWLFVRRYPAVHAVLAGLFVVGAACFVAPATRTGVRRRDVAVLALAAVGVIATPAAAQRLAGFDNFRFILSEAAPTLRFALHVNLSRLTLFGTAESVAANAERAGDAASCVGDCPSPTLQSLDWQGKSLLLITIDALRADHLGAYGYERPTSANIDRLAREGVVFERAYCATPHTSYSITSLMTGKYMRPLLLQGAGQDSETWASLLRTYGYRTAAFYPPAVFFIDAERFATFEQSHLGFEYAKVEFLEGEPRALQVQAYLETAPTDHPLFVWVHLFGPHEPYVTDPAFDFGQRAVDRYDSEIAAADRTVGRLVEAFRRRDPRSVVIVSADHGEEFGDHGGAYHGTTVYEEQVRVPLVIAAPDLTPRHLLPPVQLVDLLPTVLASLDIPSRPRIRGRDLSALLGGASASTSAYAETEDYTLLAQSDLRLVCARRLGACQLYNLSLDPGQTKNVYAAFAQQGDQMREQLQELAVSHGQFEQHGLRAEGQGWPAALMRALAGEVEAAEDVARLLDDADLEIRRKAAQVLFDLQIPATTSALRLALGRDEDPAVRAYAALALTRLGEGAPLTLDLLESGDPELSRRAALVLAETGDARGRDRLIDWWRSSEPRRYEDSVQILAALGKIGAKNLGWELARGLAQPRLLPHVARTLGKLGDDAAMGPLLQTLKQERSQKNRTALLEALLDLGADQELAVPLRQLMSEPDPFVGVLELALRAKVLQYVGGPDSKHLDKLKREVHSGSEVRVQIPGGPEGAPVRLLVRAMNSGDGPGVVYVSGALAKGRFQFEDIATNAPANEGKTVFKDHVQLHLEAHTEAHDLHVTLPVSMGLRPGQSRELSVLASPGVEVLALAVVPVVAPAVVEPGGSTSPAEGP